MLKFFSYSYIVILVDMNNLKKMQANGTRLSFTLNAADSAQFFNDEMDNRLWSSHVVYNNYVNKMIKPWADNYIMYPEISTKGRIHYHGILTVSAFDKFYLTYARKIEQCEYINMDLDTLNEEDNKWLEYCTKDRLLMEPLIATRGKGLKYSINHKTACSSLKEINTKSKKNQSSLQSYFATI